jgi:hypothetical protein
MIWVGLVLIIVGICIAKFLEHPRAEGFGIFVAVVGAIILALGAIAYVLDANDDDADLSGVIGAPFGLGLLWGRITGRVKMTRAGVLTPVGSRR